jgi:pimeloyl-ACP methyl ester carboxylesterase
MAKAQRRSTSKSVFELTSDEVEQRLAAPGDDPELREYLGDELYAELRPKVRKIRSAGAVRALRKAGPRVLILHGIMGATLGRPRWGWNAIWLNPEAIGQGQLSKLSLDRPPGTADVKTIDVLPMYYTALRVRLRDVGMNADFFAYDWRQGVEDLAIKLEAQLASDPASSISLVAHSMGGLVCRAAVKLNGPGMKKVNRIVMLGTPNFGSFVPAQVLCIAYPFVNQVIAMDVTQSNAVLTKEVFSTFPALYQMLPSHKRYTEHDLFDSAIWPAGVPKVDKALLSRSRKVLDELPADDSRFRMIAGIDQETVTSISKGTDSSFEFFSSNAGDGTVPLSLAKLADGVPTWYVPESHGGLPRNRHVSEAVIEILQSSDGQTTVLPNTWTPTRAAAVPRRVVLAQSPVAKRDIKTMTADERLEVVRKVFGPRVSDDVSGQPAPLVIVKTEVLAAQPPLIDDLEDQRAQFGGVLVGRRKRRLEILLAQGSLADCPTQAMVLGLFEGVTPTGAACALDERTDGLISDFFARRMVSGALGRVSLLPTNCTLLPTDLIAFVGLGGSGDFLNENGTVRSERLLAGASAVVRALVRLRVTEFATVLIGDTLNPAEDGVPQGPALMLRTLIKGFLSGLREGDAEQLLQRIVICVHDPAKHAKLKTDFYALAATRMFDDIELVFAEKMLKDPFAAARGEVQVRATTLPTEADSPDYLVVTDYSLRPDYAGMKFSFLTASGSGSLPSVTNSFPRSELDALLAEFDPDASLKSLIDLERLGQQLSALMFPAGFLDRLDAANLGSQPLRVVHDAPSSKIPWEAVQLSKQSPALGRGMSRHYLDEGAVRKVSTERTYQETLNVLMVVDPNRNLSGAEIEAKSISRLLGKVPRLNLVVRAGAEATRDQLKQDFQSGNYDVVHYAGHAFFDPLDPKRRGLYCADEKFLTGDDLADLSTLPALVFLNACQSGRVRKISHNAPPGDFAPEQVFQRPRSEQRAHATGVAEAFLTGGLKLFLGTYWSVGDESAKKFAEVFYENISQRKPVGLAVRLARAEVKKLGSIDWADYMLYGDPRFAIKQFQER